MLTPLRLLVLSSFLAFWAVCIALDTGTAPFQWGILLYSFLIILCCVRRSKDDGQLSAYSIHNPNQEAIAGTLTMDQFEREITHQPQSTHAAAAQAAQTLPTTRLSKRGNLPCPCGSGKKFKKCCSINRPLSQQEQDDYAQWENDWAS